MSNKASNYTISFQETITKGQNDWNGLASDNSYWSTDYFNNLSKYSPSGVESHACFVYDGSNLIAKILFQYLDVDLKNNFGSPSGEQKKSSWTQGLFKKLVIPLIKFKIIVNGNLLLSGNYGFKFSPDLDMHSRIKVFEMAIDAYRKYLKKKGIRTSGILLKDLDNPGGNLDDFIQSKRYSFFKVQPKMKFEIKGKWPDFEVYLAALKSKYRVRYRKAKKSLNGISRRLLSVEEIKKYESEIYALYMQTVSKAGFNLFLLDKAYFSGLAESKPESFRVSALFQGDKMVAFYTLMDNGNEMDAHYLGYDLGLNAKHKLYLNMLYFMVEEAIELQTDVLHMSRTALEIKSSVGTTPEEVHLYGKHFNPLLNRILGAMLDLIVPKVEWKPRNPFKE